MKNFIFCAMFKSKLTLTKIVKLEFTTCKFIQIELSQIY